MSGHDCVCFLVLVKFAYFIFPAHFYSFFLLFNIDVVGVYLAGAYPYAVDVGEATGGDCPPCFGSRNFCIVVASYHVPDATTGNDDENEERKDYQEWCRVSEKVNYIV